MRGSRRAQARFLCLNAAPARTIDVEPDLLVVNRLEHEVVGDARSSRPSRSVPKAPSCSKRGRRSPTRPRRRSTPSTATAAGDAFTACLARLAARGADRRRSACSVHARRARSRHRARRPAVSADRRRGRRDRSRLGLSVVELGDEPLRRDDPIALFDPVAQQIESTCPEHGAAPSPNPIRPARIPSAPRLRSPAHARATRRASPSPPGLRRAEEDEDLPAHLHDVFTPG